MWVVHPRLKISKFNAFLSSKYIQDDVAVITGIGVTGFFKIFHITDGGWNHTFVEIQILQPIRDIEVFMVNVTIVGDPLIPARYQ